MAFKLLRIIALCAIGVSAWGPRGGGGGFTGGFGGSMRSPMPSGGEDGALFFLLPKKKYSSAPTHKLCVPASRSLGRVESLAAPPPPPKRPSPRRRSAEAEEYNKKLGDTDSKELAKPRFGFKMAKFNLFRTLFSFGPATADSKTYAKAPLAATA